jgi:uncharacterized repeat protein (TIGR01451 family)
MNPNQQVVITFDVTINNPLPSGVTQVSNQATISGNFDPNTTSVLSDDPDTAAANDPTVTPVNNAAVSPDLTIAKTHTGNFTQGQTAAQYIITVTNSGSASTSGTVTVTDTLPAGLTASAISGMGWSCTLATLTCTRNDALTAGNSYPNIVLTVNVASNAPSSLTNSVSVAGGNEGNTSNNTATDPTTVTPVTVVGSADLKIDKSDSPDPVLLGRNITYKLEVENDGPNNATGVVVTDTLPAGVTFVSASFGCTYNPGPHNVTCNIGNLSNDREAKRTIVVQTTAIGTITNTATVTGNQTDPRVSNNTDTAQTRVVIGVLSLTLNPNRIKGGNNVIGTVTLSSPAQSDTVVILSSSNTSVAKPLVNSITISTGQSSGTFTVKTFKVSRDKTVKIKASANGTSKEATLTVKD